MELGSIRAVPSSVGPPDRAASPAPGTTGFAEELGKAIAKVEEAQTTSDREAAKLAHGEGNLHEAALALEKADISMRLATKVRNKLVEAYQEIMRMNV